MYELLKLDYSNLFDFCYISSYEDLYYKSDKVDKIIQLYLELSNYDDSFDNYLSKLANLAHQIYWDRENDPSDYFLINEDYFIDTQENLNKFINLM